MAKKQHEKKKQREQEGQPKPKKRRRGRGRPTKYSRAMVWKVDELVAFLGTEEGAKKFFQNCGVEHVASYLGIVKDTIYEWVKIYPEFSDAMKRWTTQRNAVFYAGIGSMPVATWIFLAKNWLNMTDRQVIRLRDEGPIPPDPEKKAEDEYTDEELLKIASRGSDSNDKTT